MNLEKFNDCLLSVRERLLIRWACLYYSGNPEISDSDFDKYYDAFRKSGGKDLGTGFGYKPVGATFPHPISHIGSLPKIKISEFGNSVELFGDDYLLLEITSKYDGGSAVAYYNDGRLTKILSRGGEENTGFDITTNLLHDVPITIPIMGLVGVRGEVILSWEDFEEMTPIDPITGVRPGHPRNRAVGMSQSVNSSPEEVRRLRFVAYSILGVDLNKTDMLNNLFEYGFRTADHVPILWKDFRDNILNETPYFFSPDSAIFRDRYCTMFRPIGDHLPSDGLVISPVNNPDKSIAFKFTDEEAETEVLSISWQLSKNGKFTPVANIKSVQLSGACISRVTLNSYNWMKTNFNVYDNEGLLVESKPIGVGSRIKIVRSNMIIPMVTEVLSPSVHDDLPIECPRCRGPLVKDGANFWCKNQSCDRYEKQHFVICGRFSPKFLGEANLVEFFNKFAIHNLSDLKVAIDDPDISFRISSEMTSHQSELINRMIESIRKFKPTVKDILDLSSIPDLGGVGSTELAMKVSPEEFLLSVEAPEGRVDLPKEWSDFLPTIRAFENLQDAFPRVTQVTKFFQNQISPFVPASQTRSIGVTWAMTGKLVNFSSREELGKLLESVGIKWEGPSRKTTYFVCNSASGSAKYKSAVSLGIRIVTEDEFLALLKTEYSVDLLSMKGM